MNNLLQIKAKFNSKSFEKRPIITNIPTGKCVTADHILELRDDIETLINYWSNVTLIDGALVGVFYRTVIAKSNRIKTLLTLKSEDPNIYVRGSRFSDDSSPKHIFTYYVPIENLKNTQKILDICYNYVNTKYNGQITHEDIEKLHLKLTNYNETRLAKTNFIKTIVDCYYVEKFDINDSTESIQNRSLVSIYKTNLDTKDLLEKIGINIIKDEKMLNETTVRLDPREFELLKEKAPYLISMQTHDLSKLALDEISTLSTSKHFIQKPNNEPIIGVIDTLFDEKAYFGDWVEHFDMVDDDIPKSEDDKFHGTAVSSIIVNGPELNPNLEDHCGNFRVRHFGVATNGYFSAFTVLRQIRQIVMSNSDIKVWNLSLGSALPISNNFMSPEAAELDRIQNEFDVIFVVAGTNKLPQHGDNVIRIGAPADSLNSLVVNSVNMSNKPASYHRVGPVLSFFHKPDVSYYGGDEDKKILVNWSYNDVAVQGTSFAAPWISRKIAFLIYKMHLSREIAKALIIDSAAGWDRQDNLSHAIGYGVVPIDIKDVIQSKDDEIKFFMTGTADDYETYRYDIPVPVVSDKQPFYAKATLCYFPNCSREQGVDYTDTEMDLHFGRVSEDNVNKISIRPINNNNQGEQELKVLYEEDARKLYRKWDNVKHICEPIKHTKIAKKLYGVGNWGIKLVTKERTKASKNNKNSLDTFGIVVTLKEMYGKNRYDEFVKLCNFRGIIAIPMDINNLFDIYVKAEENIIFDK